MFCFSHRESDPLPPAWGDLQTGGNPCGCLR